MSRPTVDIWESIRSTPVVLYLGTWFVGVPIEKWAAGFALVYTLILIYEKVEPKVIRRYRQWRVWRDDKDPA